MIRYTLIILFITCLSQVIPASLTASVEPRLENPGVIISPSPVRTESIIQLPINSGDYIFTLLNLEGHVVKTEGIKGKAVFNRTGLKAGSYIYKISKKGSLHTSWNGTLAIID